MNIRYLMTRYKLFRLGYLRNVSHWLIKKGLWLIHILITYLLPYLIYPEINQYRLLMDIIDEKNRYIEHLQSNDNRVEIKKHVSAYNKYLFLFRIKFLLQIILFPIAAISFIIRKIWRFFVLKVHHLDYSDESLEAGTIPGHDSRAGEIHYTLKPVNKGARIPSGLVYLRYRIASSKSDNPLLYIDQGSGFTEDYSIPLPASCGVVKEYLIELPSYTRSLKLSIGCLDGVIELSDIVLLETNLLVAAYKHAKQNNLKLVRALYEIFIREFPWTRRPYRYNQNYTTWIRNFDALQNQDVRSIQNHIAALTESISITIILCCFEGKPELLKRSIHSIQQQYYNNWILLLVSEENLAIETLSLISESDRKDSRIRVISSLEPVQSRRIIKTITDDSDCIAYLEQGDVLPSHALYMIAIHFLSHQDTEILYADHDYLDDAGTRLNPYFKPDWNYDLFLSCNYLEGILAFKPGLVIDVFDEGNKSEILHPALFIYKMIARVSEDAIYHLPFILCHKAMVDSSSPEVPESFINAMADAIANHLKNSTPNASARIEDPKNRIFRISRVLDSKQHPVSLVIPTRNHYTLLSNCIRGILERTDYSNIELIIIDNDSDDSITLEYLDLIQADPRVSVVKYPGTFNYSAINNFAVSHCSHEYIALINNDIAVISETWLSEMMGHIIRKEVGIVGAKLLYGNDTIQHAGVIIGLGGVAGHAFRYFPRNSPGVNNRLLMTQQLSCVTGACLLTKKSIFTMVNGLDDTNLKIAFNDVDYCLKVRDLGYKIIWTPYAELYHLESASRSYDLNEENIERWQSEYNYMKTKWQDKLKNDPAYNPNLTIAGEDFTLANKPRVSKPWVHYE